MNISYPQHSQPQLSWEMLFLRWLLNFTSSREALWLSREGEKKTHTPKKKKPQKNKQPPLHHQSLSRNFKQFYERIRAWIQCSWGLFSSCSDTGNICFHYITHLWLFNLTRWKYNKEIKLPNSQPYDWDVEGLQTALKNKKHWANSVQKDWSYPEVQLGLFCCCLLKVA